MLTDLKVVSQVKIKFGWGSVDKEEWKWKG